MERRRLIIDVEKCEDCNNCFLACKDEHVDNDWPGYTEPQPAHGQRWIDILRTERGRYPLIDVAYRPTPCMHCDDAPCARYAGSAVRKREDGIVLIDPEAARGDRGLVDSCPYGAIWWNDERQVAQKCTLCAHLLDEGHPEPRCVQACPTGALQLVTVSDDRMQELCRTEELEWLHPQLETRPLVYYKNLHRFHSCFVAGSVSYRDPGSGQVDCAKGARVTLLKEGEVVAETVCDPFGDFKFDRLEPESGDYAVRVSLEGFEEQSHKLVLGKSQSLVDILLEPEARDSSSKLSG